MLRNLIFLIAAVLFTSAENRNNKSMFKVCSKGRPMIENLSAKEITVQVLTADSIRFAVNDQSYNAVKIPEGNFLQGGSGEFGSYYCIFVDDNSFVAYQDRQYSYYHADASMANQPDATRCPTEAVATFEAELKRVAEARKAAANAQNKIVVSQFLKGFKPSRTDLALEKKIISFWNTRNTKYPAKKVIFLDADYDIIRDKYNQVLRKTIGAVVVYTGDQGACMMQWNRFGYEHLGGGAFNEAVNAWTADSKGGYWYSFNGVTVYAGTNFALDCTSLK